MFLVVLVAATLVVGGQWVLHRSYFSVQRVEVVGNAHESDAAILAATGLSRHPAMIDVNTTAVASRVDSFAWVKHTRVEMKWPHTVIITVTERTPVAVAYGAHHQLELVDATGVAIAPVTESSSYPLLVATHLSAGAAWPYARWAQPAAVVASQLPVAFARQVAAIDVDRSGDLTLVMTTPVTFQFGSLSELHAKFIAVASVLARPLLLHTGDTVDVSVPGALTVSGPQ